MSAPKPQFYRVKISGTLVCKSNLHIGDGTEQPMEDERGERQLQHFNEEEKSARYTTALSAMHRANSMLPAAPCADHSGKAVQQQKRLKQLKRLKHCLA